ncbi:hypothetical protein [Leucobacter sp. GX24907]
MGSRTSDIDHEEYAAEHAPRAQPLNYPGARPDRSVIVTSDRLWEVRDPEGEALDWESARPFRLGHCRVRVGPADCEAMNLSTGVLPRLNSVLEERFGVLIDGRVPVLAIGSNAAPSQMRHKFDAAPGTLLVPAIRARATGLRVGFCSFISGLGYVPATVYPEAGAVTETVVQFLDPSQLRTVDRTERGWYRRVWIDSSEFPIVLETGERLRGAYAYVALHGYLAHEEHGWVMGAPGEQRPDDVTPERWMPTQRAMFERLLRDPTVSDALGGSPEGAVGSGIDPGRSLELLRGTGLVVESNELARLPDEMDEQPRRYGSLIELFEPTAEADPDRGVPVVEAVVTGTHDLLDRRGRSVVRLGAEVDRQLGHPRHVEVVSAELSSPGAAGGRAPRALATVYRVKSDEVGDPDPRLAEVDQMLRMGIGAELGDRVLLRPVRVTRPRAVDVLLGEPNYVSFRVTLADPSSTEREVCLMSSLSLQLLGVASGDYVVLEGAADASGDVPKVTLKAFEVPEDVRDERRRVAGGGWDSRFPGVRETLGVNPDIPTVFVDSSTRARLGLTGQQLAVVRGRPARQQQFGNELREMLLLLAITFIGILDIISDTVVSSALLSLLVIGAFALVVVKMRRRLSHRAQMRRRRRQARAR